MAVGGNASPEPPVPPAPGAPESGLPAPPSAKPPALEASRPSTPIPASVASSNAGPNRPVHAQSATSEAGAANLRGQKWDLPCAVLLERAETRDARPAKGEACATDVANRKRRST